MEMEINAVIGRSKGPGLSCSLLVMQVYVALQFWDMGAVISVL